jgi:hypothetical protein
VFDGMRGGEEGGMAATAKMNGQPDTGGSTAGPAGAAVPARPGPQRPAKDTGPVRRAAPTPPPLAPPRLRRAPSLVVRPAPVPDVPPSRARRAAHLATAAVLTLAVVGGLGWLGQRAGADVPDETTTVRVGTGETVWDVAQRVAPDADPRAVVERIRLLNGMVSSAVQPGQYLQVPDGR